MTDTLGMTRWKHERRCGSGDSECGEEGFSLDHHDCRFLADNVLLDISIVGELVESFFCGVIDFIW